MRGQSTLDFEGVCPVAERPMFYVFRVFKFPGTLVEGDGTSKFPPQPRPRQLH